MSTDQILSNVKCQMENKLDNGLLMMSWWWLWKPTRCCQMEYKMNTVDDYEFQMMMMRTDLMEGCTRAIFTNLITLIWWVNNIIMNTDQMDWYTRQWWWVVDHLENQPDIVTGPVGYKLDNDFLILILRTDQMEWYTRAIFTNMPLTSHIYKLENWPDGVINESQLGGRPQPHGFAPPDPILKWSWWEGWWWGWRWQWREGKYLSQRWKALYDWSI